MSINVSDVKEIISTDLTDDQINAFIATAGIVVTRLVARCSYTFTSDEQDQIQKYLAAHLITLREPLLKSEKFEQYSQTYMRDSTGTGILSTVYGETANMISNGCLQNLDMKKVQVLYI